MIVPTEAEEGRTLVAYLRVKGYKFTHIPNETGHTLEAKRRAIRMKQQGTSKGFPDYTIITSKGLVAIELKRQKGSRVTQEQLDWLAALNACGVKAFLAYGAADAIQKLEELEG